MGGGPGNGRPEPGGRGRAQQQGGCDVNPVGGFRYFGQVVTGARRKERFAEHSEESCRLALSPRDLANSRDGNYYGDQGEQRPQAPLEKFQGARGTITRQLSPVGV